jgi:Ca-activated chloride channel family protein
MIELANPWLLLLLPLPLLAAWLLPAARPGRGAALRVPFYGALCAAGAGGQGGPRRRGVVAAKLLAWALLVLAAAGPRWVGDAQAVPTTGRDLMLALDVSGSMAQPDFVVNGRPVDRHAVVNAVARDFVARREGDRVGLVLFGTRAYLQAPLTADRGAVTSMLEESEVGLAGQETAIGDAIGLAVKRLRERPAQDRVLILLSDGASNAGVLDPLQAADLAAREGIRIYTIGVGSDAQSWLGLSVGSDLDEPTLRAIADRTGGAYFRARDTQGLIEIYRSIDLLEPTQGDDATVRPLRDLFHWPLAASVATAGLLALLGALGEAGLGATLGSIGPVERGLS